jgi:hypothetical protein
MIGPSRAGKSILATYFRTRGLQTFDLEDEGDIIAWRNDPDGQLARDKPRPLTSEWLATHHFMMDRPAMERFLAERPDSVCFAHCWNIMDCVDLFDEVYFMYLPPAEIERRMMLQRPDHSNPVSAVEVEFIMARHRQRLEESERLGIPRLDVSGTPEAIYEAFMKVRAQSARG